MKQIFKIILTYTSIVLVVSGCNTATLKYQFDPEINNLSILAKNAKIVAVSVVDSRADNFSSDPGRAVISGPGNEAKILSDKLRSILKQNGYKIINKPLLADIAFKIDIMTLNLTIEPSTFKSTIYGSSEFKLTVNKHSEQWSKIHKAGREQEVANPVNDLDATGVMNQILTKQLFTAFSDQALMNFISNQQ